MSWDRLEIGLSHERAVADKIRSLGYAVEQFGQGLLKQNVREALKETESLIRWLPDLAVLVVESKLVVLVDAKGCIKGNQNTPNHSLEMRALMAANITSLPVWYVCSEFKALSAASVIEDGPDRACCQGCWKLFLTGDPTKLPRKCPEHDRLNRRGSGTPWLLISKQRCRPLEKVFPPLIDARAS